MQELLPLYAFHLTTFHIDENESRHVVGDFKLRFAGNLDIDSFSHFHSPAAIGKQQPMGKRLAKSSLSSFDIGGSRRSGHPQAAPDQGPKEFRNPRRESGASASGLSPALGPFAN
jgi:hypothetical protein